MNTTTGETSNEWMQFYEQTVDEPSASTLGFSDATTGATSASSDINISPSGLHSPSEPKGSSSRPIRRRSRASKKTPVTLLNANAGNFRTLVQQFTGCPSKPHCTRRGPINLNFAVGSDQRSQSGVATSIMSSASSGNDYHYYQQSYQENSSHHQQHQHFYQAQQHAVPLDNVNHDAFFATSSGRANADDEILGGFNLDNISSQPLNPNENANDGNYFF